MWRFADLCEIRSANAGVKKLIQQNNKRYHKPDKIIKTITNVMDNLKVELTL